MLFVLDTRHLKEMLLRNISYLNNELDLPSVIAHMVNSNQITTETVGLINKEESRLSKIDLFLLEITHNFATSTYEHFLFALKEINPFLYRHLKRQEMKLNTG